MSLITAFGHPERGLKYSSKTKIIAHFWNELGDTVKLYWVRPNDGVEVESFTMAPGETKETGHVSNTFHGHKFAIRNSLGHKIREWTADAAKGEEVI